MKLITHRPITGAELLQLWKAAEKLEAAENRTLTKYQFSNLLGARPQRLDEWLDERDRIPLSVAILATLYATVPGAIERARLTVTNLHEEGKKA